MMNVGEVGMVVKISPSDINMQKFLNNENIDEHVVFSFKHGKWLFFEVNREL